MALAVLPAMRYCGSRGRRRTPAQIAGRPRFERTALHQRIAPAAQSGHMDVDPVLPPVNRFRRKAENGSFVWSKRSGKQASIFTGKDVFVVQDERFVKFDQLFGSSQVALGFGQWRFFYAQLFRETVDTGNNRLLHRNGKPLVALLGNRDRFKLHLQPVLNSLLRTVMLAVCQAGELDAAAHVAGIYAGSRKLVHARGFTLDEGGSDQ